MSMKYMVEALNCKVGNPIRKLILLKLADNANDNGVCFPSYNNIAEMCEVSERSVISHIKALEKMGLITVKHRSDKVKGHTSNLYYLHFSKAHKVNKKAGENVAPPYENSSEASENDNSTLLNDLHHPYENDNSTLLNDLHPNQSIEPINEPVIEPTPISHERDGGDFATPRQRGTNPRAKGTNPRATGTNPRKINPDILAVFEYWQNRTHHSKAKLDPKRNKAIKNALTWGYSVGDLCQAVDGCVATPFNQGQNDRGQVYDSLQTILKDADQVDRFMRNAVSPPVAQNKQQSLEASNMAALQRYEAMKAEGRVWSA